MIGTLSQRKPALATVALPSSVDIPGAQETSNADGTGPAKSPTKSSTKSSR